MNVLAYTLPRASEVSGLSTRKLRYAVASGDLKTLSPQVDGKTIRKTLIAPAELERWLNNQPK